MVTCKKWLYYNITKTLLVIPPHYDECVRRLTSGIIRINNIRRTPGPYVTLNWYWGILTMVTLRFSSALLTKRPMNKHLFCACCFGKTWIERCTDLPGWKERGLWRLCGTLWATYFKHLFVACLYKLYACIMGWDIILESRIDLL